MWVGYAVWEAGAYFGWLTPGAAGSLRALGLCLALGSAVALNALATRESWGWERLRAVRVVATACFILGFGTPMMVLTQYGGMDRAKAAHIWNWTNVVPPTLGLLALLAGALVVAGAELLRPGRVRARPPDETLHLTGTRGEGSGATEPTSSGVAHAFTARR